MKWEIQRGVEMMESGANSGNRSLLISSEERDGVDYAARRPMEGQASHGIEVGARSCVGVCRRSIVIAMA